MKLLEGKTALITGGSKGIGKGIVKAFAEQGANVVFTYLSSEGPAKELEKEINAMGVSGLALKSNAAQFDAAEKLVADTIEKMGQINILVNNAGITKDNLLMRMTEEQWDQVLETNLKSVFNLTKACTKPMMKQRGGSIINITSIVGRKGNAGQANYSASKAGMIGFTKSVALELGSRGIRSNAIAPGFIETEMTASLNETVLEEWKAGIPLKRIGSVEDIANSCVFLGSDLSSYITGQVLSVDGGMYT